MYLSFARLRFRGRRAAVAAAAGVVAIAAAGCSSFVSPPTASQVTPNGDIAVSSVVCLDGFDSNSGNAGAYASDCQTPQPLAHLSASSSDGYGQLLMGYAVPTGAGAPSTLSSPDLPGVTFTQNAGYATYLAGDEKTPTGYSWVGYMSAPFTITASTEVDITADFSTPATSGSLYAGPFTVEQVVVGDRADDDDPGSLLGSSRALNCSGAGLGSVNDTGCVNDSSPSPLNVATRELASLAPSAAITVHAGSTATVPFTVEYSGPSADPFDLSASTSSNALVAAPANATFTPSGSGNTVENVTVPVPAGLAPGSYSVTLNVGSFGSTAATLNVTAAPAPTTATNVATAATPAVRPAITGLNVISSSLKLTMRLNIASTARVTLQRKRGHRWVTLKKLSVRGSAGLNTLHLRGLFGSLLKPAGRYQVTVQAFAGTVGSPAQWLTFTVR